MIIDYCLNLDTVNLITHKITFKSSAIVCGIMYFIINYYTLKLEEVIKIEREDIDNNQEKKGGYIYQVCIWYSYIFMGIRFNIKI